MIKIGVEKTTVNPRTVLVRNHTIPIAIKKIYTDVDGTVIDKNTIPLTLKKKVPVLLLGEFDRQGGYKIGLQSLTVDPSLKYVMTFVNGNGASVASVIGWTGIANINNSLNVGDIVLVYTDDLLAPSYFVWVVVQNTYASIASIIGNTESTQNDRRIGPIAIHAINYIADNDNQLSESIQILHYSNIGTFNANQIEPLGIFRTPFDVQTGLVRIVCEPFILDQYTGMAFNMLFESDMITMDFKIKTY